MDAVDQFTQAQFTALGKLRSRLNEKLKDSNERFTITEKSAKKYRTAIKKARANAESNEAKCQELNLQINYLDVLINKLLADESAQRQSVKPGPGYLSSTNQMNETLRQRRALEACRAELQTEIDASNAKKITAHKQIDIIFAELKPVEDNLTAQQEKREMVAAQIDAITEAIEGSNG